MFSMVTATTAIATLSLHAALPISVRQKNPDDIPVLDVDFLLRSDPTRTFKGKLYKNKVGSLRSRKSTSSTGMRSEDHTAEPQSRQELGCRPLPDTEHLDGSCCRPD